MYGTVRTRHKSENKMSLLFGSGQAFLESELPTLRALLRLGVKLREDQLVLDGTAKNLYTTNKLAGDLAEAVLVQYRKANNEFKPPVVSTKKSLHSRIEKDWKRAELIAWNGKKKNLEDFFSKLDRLYDITKCRCKIIPCSVKPPCLDARTGKFCRKEAHSDCVCLREQKLPELDLLFIHMQRQKIGEKGALFISTPDFKDSKRQVKKQSRKDLEKERLSNNKRKAETDSEELYDRQEFEDNMEEEQQKNKDDHKHFEDNVEEQEKNKKDGQRE